MSSKIVKLNGHKLKTEKIIRKVDRIVRSIDKLEIQSFKMVQDYVHGMTKMLRKGERKYSPNQWP
jgi:hypothetical protein